MYPGLPFTRAWSIAEMCAPGWSRLNALIGALGTAFVDVDTGPPEDSHGEGCWFSLGER
jgi:hypothetical protein